MSQLRLAYSNSNDATRSSRLLSVQCRMLPANSLTSPATPSRKDPIPSQSSGAERRAPGDVREGSHRDGSGIAETNLVVDNTLWVVEDGSTRIEPMVVLPFRPAAAPTDSGQDETSQVDEASNFNRKMEILRAARPNAARAVEAVVDRLMRKYGLSA